MIQSGPSRFPAERHYRSSVGPALIALHCSHSFQLSWQCPHPFIGSSFRGDPVMMIGFPMSVFLMNQAASEGLMFSQPWLTLEYPCDPTDQGALCTYSPELEIRTVL